MKTTPRRAKSRPAAEFARNFDDHGRSGSCSLSARMAHAAASPRTDVRNRQWLRDHAIDVVTLLVTTILVVKFWWAFLGLHDRLVLAAAAIASTLEAARRINGARRQGLRPVTVSANRRLDLFAGIVLGTGPWPIAQVLDGGPVGAAWQSFACPPWLRVLGVTGILGLSVWRLVFAESAGPTSRPAIRQLASVPDLHTASMLLFSTAGTP